MRLHAELGPSANLDTLDKEIQLASKYGATFFVQFSY
jgi:hypothetical protein